MDSSNIMGKLTIRGSLDARASSNSPLVFRTICLRYVVSLCSKSPRSDRVKGAPPEIVTASAEDSSIRLRISSVTFGLTSATAIYLAQGPRCLSACSLGASWVSPDGTGMLTWNFTVNVTIAVLG